MTFKSILLAIEGVDTLRFIFEYLLCFKLYELNIVEKSTRITF